MKSIFSIDVEDWFHILDVPGAWGPEQWADLPSRVESNFLRLLDIFHKHHVHATCFFLGWIAERYPNLVREAVASGHEVASHGYTHQLVHTMQASAFRIDALRAKETLEDIAGRQVLGYRCAGFSATEKVPWFFDQLMEAGYTYDSSVFPGRHSHGGIRRGLHAPYVVRHVPLFVEFPISLSRVLGGWMCFFGGGYLRLAPSLLIRYMARAVLRQGRPVIYYVHPREIDCGAPRLQLPTIRRFKCYVNLKTTEPKLDALLATFEFVTFAEFLTEHFGIGSPARSPEAVRV